MNESAPHETADGEGAPTTRSRLPSLLSKLIVDYATGKAGVPAMVFGEIESWDLNSKSISGSITIDEKHRLKIEVNSLVGDQKSFDCSLIDNSTLTAAYIAVRNRSFALTPAQRSKSVLIGYDWTWKSNTLPIAYVGVLQGYRPFVDRNLAIKGYGESHCSAKHMRGNLHWTFVRRDDLDPHSCLVFVSSSQEQPFELDRQSLRIDFAALEFVMGCPIRLEMLIGVDSHNLSVSAMNFETGIFFQENSCSKAPVSDSFDSRWSSVAFTAVATNLCSAEPAFQNALYTYLATHTGYVETRYLVAQVALEAFAKHLKPSEKPIVKDKAAWKKLIDSLSEQFREHVADDSVWRGLETKLKRDVITPTTSTLVKDYLAAAAIEVPAEALQEVNNRSLVVHENTMQKAGTPEDPTFAQRSRRLEIIQTLLAALILRHAGYSGALAGWDNEPSVAWWPISEAAMDQSQVFYLAEV